MSKLPRMEPVNIMVNTVLNFHTLKKGSCTDKCTIMGCIVNCFPIQPSAVYGKYRKLLLKELMPDGTLGDKELPCFLYGKFVDQIRDLVRGDCITVKGFEVMPNQFYKKNSRMIQYQIEVISTNFLEPKVQLHKKKIIKFDDLCMISKRYGGIFVVGRVIRSSETKKIFDEYEKVLTLKEVLPDGELSHMSMDCILHGKIANQYKMIKEGDTVKLSGFYVEARPSTSAITDYYQYQVVLRPVKKSEKDEEPSVNVVKGSKKENLNFLQKPRVVYKYTLLKDLREGKGQAQLESKHFNVYGVVVRCIISNSVISKCLEIVIRDPSLDSFALVVSMRPDSSSVPDIHPNDIIRIHRMYLNEHRSGLQGFCNSTNDLLVFSGTSASMMPSRTSRTFTWTDHDTEKVDKLRKWNSQATTLHPECMRSKKIFSGSGNNETVLPKSMQENIESNYDCSFHIPMTAEQEMPDNLAGSDCVVSTKLSKPAENKSPSKGIAGTLPYLSESRNYQHTSSNAQPESVLTSVSKVVADRTVILKHKLTLNEEDVSCKLSRLLNPNVPCDVNQMDGANVADNGEGQIDGDSFINAYKKSLKVRQLCKPVVRPVNVVSVVNNPTDQIVTIGDMKGSHLHKCGRVRVRVVDIKPQPVNIEDSVHLHCSKCLFITTCKLSTNVTFFQIGNKKYYICPMCEKVKKMGQVLEHFLVFNMKLDDGSGAINAYLIGKSAEFFFGETELGDTFDIVRIQGKLRTVCNDSECFDNPPVLDCNLFKFQTKDGHAFQIVGTKLLL